MGVSVPDFAIVRTTNIMALRGFLKKLKTDVEKMGVIAGATGTNYST